MIAVVAGFVTMGQGVSGVALADRILDCFSIGDSGLVAEQYEPSKTNNQPCFNWAAGVWLSALNAAARADQTFGPAAAQYADATRAYWNDAGPVPGYDVLPAPKPVDRYYDDNAWMVMALIETFELTKQKKYLADAQRAMKYVMSGMDDKLGGGIYWRESDRGASKNTCSNAPSSAALLALYAHTKDIKQLQKANTIYMWTKKTLRDSADGLMWDNISADGKIGKYKWSYNTALMIRTAVDLYRFSDNKAFRTDAVEFARASKKHWLTPSTGELKCEGKFAHLLLESWQLAAHRIPELRPELAPGIQKVKRHLAFHAANQDGWFMGRWDAKPFLINKVPLIDQASVVRALLYRPD